MPVGRRELERWSQQQQERGGGSGGIAQKVRAAHASGVLNLVGAGLATVPAELLNWHVPIGDENWCGAAWAIHERAYGCVELHPREHCGTVPVTIRRRAGGGRPSVNFELEMSHNGFAEIPHELFVMPPGGMCANSVSWT
jgi:hypothetical protein